MTCPTCDRPVEKAGNKQFPFCCERCRLVDLGHWIGEDYRIPDRDTPIDPAEIVAARTGSHDER